MSAYAIAWIVIVACVLAAAAILFRLLRNMDKPLVRTLLISLLVTLSLAPAPVPGHPEQWAPAFVVYIFETFFQIDGAPQVSLRILLLAVGVVGLLVWLASVLLNRRKIDG